MTRYAGRPGDNVDVTRWVTQLGSQLSGQASLRLSDDERERAVRELGEHYAVGRLTAEEHLERTEAAWAAKTRGDIAPLFRDLPARRPSAAASPARRRGRGAVPAWLVLLLAVLAGLTVLVQLPVFLFLALAWWVVVGHARHRWPQRFAGRPHHHRHWR